MITISLTQFVDFVSTAGTPKLRIVRIAKQQSLEGYHPAKDFWKRLREFIVQMHADGRPKSAFDGFLKSLTDKKKQTAYPEAVNGYKKFLGRKKPTWFHPPKDVWTQGNLSVSLNPELGLDFEGTRHAIKLYFKMGQLSKKRADIITHLMHLVLKADTKDASFGVLDVRRSKLFAPPTASENLTALVQGEAVSFATIYDVL